VVNGDWAQYINQFRTRIAGGLNTDILAMAIEGARLTVVQDLVLPIDDFIAEDPEAQTILEDIHPVLHNALKYQDATYYMTREWNNMIIHYNTQLFEEAGLERRQQTGPGMIS
jgi:multiple sugar transport system substrate-binding protein